jgi:hypothetical protein
MQSVLKRVLERSDKGQFRRRTFSSAKARRGECLWPGPDTKFTQGSPRVARIRQGASQQRRSARTSRRCEEDSAQQARRSQQISEVRAGPRSGLQGLRRSAPSCSNQSDANNCAAGSGPATPRQPAMRHAELPPPSPRSRAVPIPRGTRSPQRRPHQWKRRGGAQTRQVRRHLRGNGAIFSPFALETTGGHGASTASVYLLFTESWTNSRGTSRSRFGGARSQK